MQLKLVAAPLVVCAGLGLGGAALAAPSVTMYGVADAGVGHSRYSFDQDGVHARYANTGFRSGQHHTSRWGLKGSEDLGGGLKAVFNLEGKIDLADGGGEDFRRRAFVGLAGHWGTLTLGRQKNVGDSFLKLTTVRSLGKAERAFGVHGPRISGLVKYMSPRLGGFRAGIGYARADGYRDWITSGVVHASGPLRLAAAYDRQRPTDKSGQPLGWSVHNWALAMGYDFGSVRLTAGYGQDRGGKLKKPGDVSSKTLGGFSPAGLGDYNSRGFRSRNYYLGATVPLGSSELGFSWSRSSSNLARVYANQNGGAKLASATQNIIAAQYLYHLSRRTRLYAWGAHAWGLAYLKGFKGRVFGVGLYHAF